MNIIKSATAFEDRNTSAVTEHAGPETRKVSIPTTTTKDGGSEDRIEPRVPKRSLIWDFKARGEPFLWGLGGALAIGMLMIVGFISLILYNGVPTFYPKPIEAVRLKDGTAVAGEITRWETFKPEPEFLAKLDEEAKAKIAASGGMMKRILFRTGNFDLYNEDFRWVLQQDIAEKSNPSDIFFVERVEWGPFIGTVESMNLNGNEIDKPNITRELLNEQQALAAGRRDRIRDIERNEIGSINTLLEKERLKLRKAELRFGKESPEYHRARDVYQREAQKLETQYRDLSKEAVVVKEKDAKFTITFADVSGKKVTMRLSQIVNLYPANILTTGEKLKVYFARWWEFLTQEPREANTEGGVMPAIFGTFCMTVLMALAVAPFGVIAALYLREYAKQGRLVSIVRISVNNLAGVPSIVYGVFGLGFFAYLVGGSLDNLFYPERLPSPTYGTGGLLWASLTLALLTVPVVIVATEEALAAVPQSMREGSLACGASKWQTIKWIVLPRAMPGIMTGLILAMARGAGEVAPLMLIGVVKMAPELPIDHFFPYIHLERSFMHLGFHIYDVGFQSRNSEAAKPMVFVTTLLLIALVFAMNAASIMIRNRLKRKFYAGHF
ncbi:phosphate ABC transporter permease PstA [Desulfomonile tiedjei]|uniref:Phosphate transport system permease protein PstA n=1 Tax=Desulfomonile tiedjei (strain ATCC 49306 / DSM 6799 / DCB-1) TaxID=706587 RepID=I4CD22_DESTA|nr:phosphate ABC transporter permease PstA [Desulfomonile tiedjei]AFM27463.1 phosphate ABC transporter, permease protein PstA [Desulfomonile tiedjei DSM 6799]